MDYSKLRGRVKEFNLTEGLLANKINLSRTAISSRFNNKTPWKMNEIEKVCEVLEIPLDQAYLYFFRKKV